MHGAVSETAQKWLTRLLSLHGWESCPVVTPNDEEGWRCSLAVHPEKVGDTSVNWQSLPHVTYN